MASSVATPSAATRTRVEESLCALMSIPKLGPSRAAAILEVVGPEEAFSAVASEAPSVLAVLSRYRDCRAIVQAAQAMGGCGESIVKQCRKLGIQISVKGDWLIENHLLADLQTPVVIYSLGNLELFELPRVAIVGTRSATAAGRSFAELLGCELCDSGCAVVSGLALGIDASAHAGALSSASPAPIGIVGSGLDVVYPRPNADLWRRVREAGVLVSEYPPGTRPTENSFPARNRVIATAGQVVVVVESGESGGSMITVERAWERNRAVMAVPGNPLTPSCRGSNRLLKNALSPTNPVIACVETADVLAVLSLDSLLCQKLDDRREPSALALKVLEVIGWEAMSTSKIVAQLVTAAFGDVVDALGELEMGGWVRHREGRWNQVPR